MTWFSLGPFYIQILYSFTWLLVCCWFWSHSCIVTVKLNNQTNISANQTQIFTQLNLYCMYNMCPEMCPRKWCGRKTAWKKLCCSSGICQMYSILFCKQWPMYARNISCLVLSCLVCFCDISWFQKGPICQIPAGVPWLNPLFGDVFLIYRPSKLLPPMNRCKGAVWNSSPW